MQVFLLLDQDVTPLKAFPLHGKGVGPVTIHAVGTIPPGVSTSFNGAAIASYNFITKNGKKSNHSIFAYEIDPAIASRIYGGSGALAFSIAAIYEMLGLTSREVIGATGVIADTQKGTIGRVSAINEKIKTLLEKKPGITIIFYPRANDPDIELELKIQLKKSNIKFHPVKSLGEVCQALPELIFPPHPPWWLLLLLIIYFAYTLSSHSTAIYLLENEHYPFAKWHLKTASRLAFFNSELQKTATAFEKPLEAQGIFSIRFSIGREETYPVDRVPPEFLISDKDVFSFRIEPYDPIYVYMVQSDGSGSFRKLYPSGKQAQAISTTTRIPAIGVSFKPEGKSGNKDIYMVFSRWRCLDLEKALFASNPNFSFPAAMNKYNLEENCVQLKKISMTLQK
jgi:hypothetical protein